MEILEQEYARIGLAALLGMLVGLQREATAAPIAGLRTFTLITLLGAVCGVLAQRFDGWILAAGLLAVAALVVAAEMTRAAPRSPRSGQSTAFAVLLMFGVGAYTVVGDPLVAVVVGAGTAVLLQFKAELHGLVARLGERDLRAVMQFALITGVVLPVVPNRGYGPLDALNPFEVWLMVVLIVGISLLGYVAYRSLGRRTGMVVGGLVGGLISSTATTFSAARRIREGSSTGVAEAAVVTLASVMTFARVAVEMAAVSPTLLREAAWPLTIAGAWTLLLALGLVAAAGRVKRRAEDYGNPADLKSAFIFAALYAIVVLAIALAQEHGGGLARRGVAALSGLTDMDAVTLSTANLVSDGQIDPGEGWRLVLIAAASNLVFKGAAATFIGGRAALARVAPAMALAAVGTLSLALFW